MQPSARSDSHRPKQFTRELSEEERCIIGELMDCSNV